MIIVMKMFKIDHVNYVISTVKIGIAMVVFWISLSLFLGCTGGVCKYMYIHR